MNELKIGDNVQLVHMTKDIDYKINDDSTNFWYAQVSMGVGS